jgi:hypothetical protein
MVLAAEAQGYPKAVEIRRRDQNGETGQDAVLWLATMDHSILLQSFIETSKQNHESLGGLLFLR